MLIDAPDLLVRRAIQPWRSAGRVSVDSYLTPEITQWASTCRW